MCRENRLHLSNPRCHKCHAKITNWCLTTREPTVEIMRIAFVVNLPVVAVRTQTRTEVPAAGQERLIAQMGDFRQLLFVTSLPHMHHGVCAHLYIHMNNLTKLAQCDTTEDQKNSFGTSMVHHMNGLCLGLGTGEVGVYLVSRGSRVLLGGRGGPTQ